MRSPPAVAHAVHAVLVLSAVACQPGDATVDRVEGDTEAFEDDFTLAFCTRQQECHPNTAIVSFGVEGCRDELETFGGLESVGFDPRSVDYCSVDAIAARRCLDALDSVACDEQASLVEVPATCDAAFFACDIPEPPIP